LPDKPGNDVVSRLTDAIVIQRPLTTKAQKDTEEEQDVAVLVPSSVPW
jgi:hypothetical protein